MTGPGLLFPHWQRFGVFVCELMPDEPWRASVSDSRDLLRYSNRVRVLVLLLEVSRSVEWTQMRPQPWSALPPLQASPPFFLSHILVIQHPSEIPWEPLDTFTHLLVAVHQSKGSVSTREAVNFPECLLIWQHLLRAESHKVGCSCALGLQPQFSCSRWLRTAMQCRWHCHLLHISTYSLFAKLRYWKDSKSTRVIADNCVYSHVFPWKLLYLAFSQPW